MKDTKLLGLVKKAKNRNQKAFAKLCELKVNEVIFLCVREMGNQADGQDAAQEVFIQMQKSLPLLKEPEAFNVWLNKLIRNTCLSMRRKNLRHSDMLGSEAFEDFVMDETLAALPQEFVEQAEHRQRLLDIIDSLPGKYRACVTLHYYQSLSYAEIAEVLDMDTDAVNNNMRMARKYIKRELEAGQAAGQHASAFSVMLAPMLAQVFSEAAEATVSATAAQQCLSAVGVTLAAGTAAGAGILSGFAAKAAATLAAVALTAAAGTGLYAVSTQHSGSSGPEPPASQAASLPQGGQYGLAGGSGLEDISVLANTLAGRVWLRQGDALPQAYNGLAGVVLELVAAEDDERVLYSITTQGGSEDGYFTLGYLPDGKYKLRVTLPEGASLTQDSPAKLVGTGDKQKQLWLQLNGAEEFTLEGGIRLDGLDLELELPTLLTGRLAFTLDGAAIEYDDGYLPGVYMELYDPDGVLVATAPISSEGHYAFTNPMIAQQGPYTLHVATTQDAPVAVNIPDQEVLLEPGYRTA